VSLSIAPGDAYQFDWSHEIVLLSGVTVTMKVAHVRLRHSPHPRLIALRPSWVGCGTLYAVPSWQPKGRGAVPRLAGSSFAPEIHPCGSSRGGLRQSEKYQTVQAPRAGDMVDDSSEQLAGIESAKPPRRARGVGANGRNGQRTRAALGMTQAEYARHRGVSRQYINELVRTGRLKLRNGRIDPVLGDKVIAENSVRLPVGGLASAKTVDQIDSAEAGDRTIEENSTRARNAAEIDNGSPLGGLTRAKTATEVLRSKLAELRLAEREGELLRSDDVLKSVGECGEAIMRELKQLPLRAEELGGAFMQGKAAGLRAALTKVVFEIQSRIYETMRDYEKQSSDMRCNARPIATRRALVCVSSIDDPA
jgi:hypothetical protein